MSKFLDYNGLSHFWVKVKEQINTKVDKETGKGLSTNDFTTAEKEKLANVAAGAEVNVQSDWNVTSSTDDAFIKNKPTLGTAAAKDFDSSIAAASTSAGLPTSAAVASFVEGKNYLAATLKGANNGLAELDATGKVPSTQLPSYVDDVLEYSARSAFPAKGETGKIYVDTTTNLTYRWSGSGYVEISASLALGTTASTAYRGDLGAAAYAHAVTNKGAAFPSGLYSITTNAEGHVTAATAIIKEDITALGIPAQDTTYEEATAAAAGLMSSSDKAKLDEFLSASNYITDISGKVDKVEGKGLSTNDYTTAEKNKLAGIAAGAEVNVQSDWNVTNITSDAYIANKPSLGAAAAKGVDTSISVGSTSANLPTTAAVVSYLVANYTDEAITNEDIDKIMEGEGKT